MLPRYSQSTGIIIVNKRSFAIALIIGVPVFADVVNVYPDKLDFGTQVVYMTSSQGVTLSNPTKKPLNISDVTVTGDGFFLLDSSCGATLPPNSSCSLFVALRSTVVGAATG